MSGYTKRLLIVARADMAAKANAAAFQPDTDESGGGDKTFVVGLSASGNAPAQAYWCSWQMKAATALAIRQRLRDQGATVAETTPVVFGQTPASNRFAVFDAADGWTPDLVLAALNLKIVEVAPP